MKPPQSQPSALDPVLAVVAILTAVLIFPFAFAPLTREASLAALDGLAIVRGETSGSTSVVSGEVGASVFAAAALVFGSERTPETLAAAFALWHWLTALMVFLVARRAFGRGAVLGALVYTGAIAAGGTWTVFSPEALAALPIVLAVEFASEEGRARRAGFGLVIGVGIALARETMFLLMMYAFDQFRRNANRAPEYRNRFGTWELAGLLAGLVMVVGLAGRADHPIEVLRSMVVTHSFVTFAPVERLSGSALVLFAAAGWFALGVRSAAEASNRRLIAGGTIALGLVSIVRPAGDAAAHLPFAGLGALAVAGVYAALMRTAPFPRASRLSAVVVGAGVLLASPLPFAARSVTFIGPFLRGEDVVAFHGRFFDHGTGYDAALTVDAANWIAGNTGPSDSVAVWGSEPGLFLISERAAMCGFTTIIPILDGRSGEAERFTGCLREGLPHVIVVVRNPRHWSGGFSTTHGYSITKPEAFRHLLRSDYRRVQRLGGFDLHLRNDLAPKHVPLATIYELNVPREP